MSRWREGRGRAASLHSRGRALGARGACSRGSNPPECSCGGGLLRRGAWVLSHGVTSGPVVGDVIGRIGRGRGVGGMGVDRVRRESPEGATSWSWRKRAGNCRVVARRQRWHNCWHYTRSRQKQDHCDVVQGASRNRESQLKSTQPRGPGLPLISSLATRSNRMSACSNGYPSGSAIAGQNGRSENVEMTNGKSNTRTCTATLFSSRLSWSQIVPMCETSNVCGEPGRNEE